MDKVIKTVVLFCILWTFLGCNGSNQFNENIILKPRWWVEINLKKKSIYIDLTKQTSKLELSVDEERMIFNSFEKNGLGKLQGEYHVADRDIITPIVDFIFLVIDDNKKVLDVSINEQYKKKPNSKSVNDRLASFRDDVKLVLENNISYKKVEKDLDNYIKENNINML